MDIGIDKIGFYTPRVYVDMEKLAKARDIDPGKFIKGIGQEKMAVAPTSEDSVTMAANAALEVLDEEDREAIDFVLFGTETGVDHSKSGAVWVHQLTDINKHARSVELKQACYSATAGIKMALGHIALNPDRKVLVLGTDVARYGLKTGGEPTQGAGAVAIILSANPSILSIENDGVSYTKEISDFWRPLYSEFAYVDGKFSNEAYLDFLVEVWEEYKTQTGKELADFETLLFHVPYTKMGKKAVRKLAETESEEDIERLMSYYESSIYYNKLVGNIYTGSLYLSLLSFLEQAPEQEEGTKIGLFSYGSGAVGEFFSGTLKANYKDHVNKEKHEALLENRRELTINEYETMFEDTLPKDGSDIDVAPQDTAEGDVVLAGLKGNIRQYKKV